MRIRPEFLLGITVLFVLHATAFGELEFRKIKAEGLVAIVVEIPESENHGFSLVDVPTPPEGDQVRNHWQDDFTLMLNGCFFDPQFKPVGLYVLEGQVINRRKNPSFSGVVTIDKKGRLGLHHRTDDVSKAFSAFQSRPYVIDPGGKIGIHSDNGKISERSLVGRKRDGSLVFMATSRVSLYQLARAVKKELPDIERLLNMDGGPSAAFKLAGYERRNRSPVRSYLAKKK